MNERFDWLGLNAGRYGLQAGEFSELTIEKFIIRYVGDGDVAIDCGVADGRMLNKMIASCGSSGFVIGFEPIPHIYEKLRSDFSLPNVALVRACVSETLAASVPFYHVKERRWISSLSPSHLDGYDVETIQVPVTTLDATLAEMEFLDSKRVSFIKLDIEGAEFPAIRGGSDFRLPTIHRF